MPASLRLGVLVAAVVSTFALQGFLARAQEATESKAAPQGTTPANSGLQREYARLAQLLNSDDVFGKREAAESLLKVRPSDVANADTRKLIARGYKSLAKDEHGMHEDEAIRGLVIWGGKYSVPILIELLEKDRFGTEALYSALGQLKDPRGAEAMSRKLGDFHTHDKAVNALRRMGPAAEDALIKAAPHSDPEVSLAAVQLLGEVGGEKSMAILQKASGARNFEVKQAARESMKKIRTRMKSGAAPAAEEKEDPNSPFAEGSGPPVDITARNTRDFGSRREMDRDIPGVRNFEAADEAEDGSTELNEGDWSEIHALLPGDPAGAGVSADPARDETKEWKPQPVRLGKRGSQQERPTSLSVTGGKSPVGVVLHTDPFSKSMARLELLDLHRRRSLASSNIVGGVTHCYVSPSAQRVLVFAEEGFHDRKVRLDVLSIAGNKTSELATWWPFATSADHWANELTWAGWVDDEQVIIVNGQGTLVLWRLDGKTPKAIYQLDAEGRSTPALSPGRAHLAMATARGVEVFRSSDGELLARMADVRPSAGAVAFNAIGTKLACVSGPSIYIWDATTGKLERDFDCAEVAQGPVHWLDDQHLLIGGTDIVDLTRRLILWRYETPPYPAATQGDWRWLVMESGNILGVVPVKLLQDEVLAAADGLDPEAILALKPGAEVALDVQVGGEEQAKAESALKAALEQTGMKVAADSPIKLSARIITGQSETKEYGRGFFNREDREQVTVTAKSYEVELTIDGQSAWKQASLLQSGSGPGVVWLEGGESAQAAIDRQNAQRLAGFAFTASIPRYVVHPEYRGPLGTSKISLGGSR